MPRGGGRRPRETAGGSVERIGIVGAGRLGSALARALGQVGWPVVAVASRTPAHARTLAAAVSGARAVDTPQAVADVAELVFLTVPDTAIASVAASVRWRAGQGVVHTSGVESLTPLASAREHGALLGSLHPLQTFARPSRNPLRSFRGITCAIESDPELFPRLESVVTAVGGEPLLLAPEAKALYHAAAVLAANYVVSLLHVAAQLWRAAALPEDRALQALLPLTRAAVENVAARGPAAALTGPIARGDVETIEKHLGALAAATPEHLALYRELGEATLALARAAGQLDAARAAAVAARLRAPRRRVAPRPPAARAPSRGERSAARRPRQEPLD